MDYTFLANLLQEFALPENGVLSRVLHKDDKVNVTLFGFSAGQELSAHSAPTSGHSLFSGGRSGGPIGRGQGQCPTGSFVYMPPMLPHGISAKTALRMLLVQMKDQSN